MGMKKRRKWENREIETLKKLFCEDGLGSVEIAPILNRTKTSIHLKVKKLKIRHSKTQTFLLKSRLNKGCKNGMFGRSSWKKGQTKETCERVRNAGKIVSEKIKERYLKGLFSTKGKKNGMYGKSSWRKGQTKENNKKVALIGQKCSETKKRQWKELPENEKERRRRQWALQGLKCPKKDTKIEIITKNVLDNLNIKYKKNYPLNRWIVDFYTDSGKVIECQGDYWHCNPKKFDIKDANIIQKNNIKRDQEKIKYLKANNIPFLFLWEDDILNSDITPLIKEFL